MMKINKLKLRGLGQAPETGWIDFDPRLTCIRFKTSARRDGFIRAIETINPPYDCTQVQPFADYPTTFEANRYHRTISPSNRTIVLSIFDSTPQLVHQLAQISPLLYETDLIEIGRRLDYSRWMNFIELASSTRWTEIKEDISGLIQICKTDCGTVEIPRCLETLQPSDRIKGSNQKTIHRWLNQLLNDFPDKKELIRPLLFTINRSHHFNEARTLVYEHLPLMVRFDITGNRTDKDASPLKYLLGRCQQEIFSTSVRPDSNNTPLLLQMNNAFESFSFLQERLVLESMGQNLSLLSGHARYEYNNAGTLKILTHIQTSAALAIALAQVLNRAEPVFIFNISAHHFPPQIAPQIIRLIGEIACYCQCIIGSENEICNSFDGACHDEADLLR